MLPPIALTNGSRPALGTVLYQRDKVTLSLSTRPPFPSSKNRYFSGLRFRDRFDFSPRLIILSQTTTLNFNLFTVKMIFFNFYLVDVILRSFVFGKNVDKKLFVVPVKKLSQVSFKVEIKCGLIQFSDL